MVDEGEALIGTGILLKAGDGANPEQFVSIAELLTIKPPSHTRNEVDVTPVSGDRDAKLLGILRRGQCTGMLNLLPSDPTQLQMLADIQTNKKRNYQIAYPPDGFPTWQFAARLQLFDVQEISVDTPIQVAYALTLAKGDIAIVNE